MKTKFLEVFLAAAIALSATKWTFNNKTEEDGHFVNTYNPSELLDEQVNFGDNLNTNYPQQHLTFKEEQRILDTIINLEESQRNRRSRTVARPITTFIAYPLVSQSSDGQSYGSGSEEYSPSLQSEEVMVRQEGASSPLPGRPSSTQSWPPSPPSPIDDGGLFGAIGYAPWSNNQYFDIESFLNPDFSSELSEQDFSSLSQHDFLCSESVAASDDSWVDKRINSVTSEQSESLEELAQFLEASIETPTSPDMPPKRSMPEFLQQKSMLSDMLGGGSNSFIKKDGGIISSPLKGKENPIADVKSYDYIRDEPTFPKRAMFKKEPSSPTGSESSWTRSSDNDRSDYASSTGSSHDKDHGRKQNRKEFATSRNKQIWIDLPYTKDDLINTKIEEFNDILTKLEPLQQHIAKDIRRKGKNKLAARNCRKRKIDAIDGLGVGVNVLERQRQMLLDERLQLQLEKDEIVRKTEFLYEHIFKNLRDDRGQLYSQENYALTYTADGSVYLVRKQNSDIEEVRSR